MDNLNDNLNVENTGVIKKKKKEKDEIVSDICDLMESVLFSIFVVILIFTFIFKVASVIGTSMLPTLEEKDKLIISSAFYSEPKQKDIIIIDAQDAHLLTDTNNDGVANEVIVSEGIHKTIVKRVIATEGQTVDIDFSTGNVYIDGEVINEPYINNLTLQNNHAFEYPITIPDGYVFVMGDNREVSKDSRSQDVGLIAESDIIGKAIFRVSPMEKFGFLE